MKDNYKRYNTLFLRIKDFKDDSHTRKILYFRRDLYE